MLELKYGFICPMGNASPLGKKFPSGIFRDGSREKSLAKTMVIGSLSVHLQELIVNCYIYGMWFLIVTSMVIGIFQGKIRTTEGLAR